MLLYVVDDVENLELLSDEEFIQYAIDLSNKSIANHRRELDELKKII